MRSEPTVTINTKEALADVFGMYNSPDKTLKIERPGSKHAPVKKVELLHRLLSSEIRQRSQLATRMHLS